MVQSNNKQSQSNNQENGKKPHIKRITTDEEKKEIQENRNKYKNKSWVLLRSKNGIK